jgi:hypothetical protein
VVFAKFFGSSQGLGAPRSRRNRRNPSGWLAAAACGAVAGGTPACAPEMYCSE